MSHASRGPFVDDFSKLSGGVWTIELDDAASQLTQLANALNQANLVAELAPPTVNGDTEHPAPPPLTSDGKRAIFEKISAALDSASLKEVKDSDVVAFCNLFMSVGRSIFTSASESSPHTLRLAKAVSGLGSAAGFARYQALVTLFNSLPTGTSPEVSFALLVALLRLAASEPLPSTLEVVKPIIKALPEYISTLKPSRADADSAVSNALIVAEREPTLAHALLKAYFSQADAVQASEELRTAYLALSLRLPKSFDFPSFILSSGSLEAQLAGLVLAGKAAEIEAKSDLPKRVGARELLVAKARSVAIARVLAAKAGQTLGYDELRNGLGSSVQDDLELEGWIIDAIKAGLVSARLSQPRRQISVLRAQLPNEDGQDAIAAEWQAISARLTTWKAALDKMLSTVRSATGDSVAEEPVDVTRRGGIEIEAA